MFIRLKNDNDANVSEVSEIWVARLEGYDAKKWQLLDHEGKSKGWTFDLPEFEGRDTIVSAAPGIVALGVVWLFEKGENFIKEYPVVAWLIQWVISRNDFIVSPVFPDFDNFFEPLMLHLPDDTAMQTWDTLKEALADLPKEDKAAQ
jgi:hypothetical protein